MCLSWESYKCHEQYQTNLCSEACLWKTGQVCLVCSWIHGKTYPENRMLYIPDTDSLLRKKSWRFHHILLWYIQERELDCHIFILKIIKTSTWPNWNTRESFSDFHFVLNFVIELFYVNFARKARKCLLSSQLRVGVLRWEPGVHSHSQSRQGKALRLSYFRFILDWGKNFISSE